MNRIAGQIAETIRILNEAYDTWNPSTVVACFSGGDDSAVMTHIAVQWAKEKGISLVTMAADTLISADGWREYVTDAAAKIGATYFEIWDNPDLGKWIKDVQERGFVYRKAQHPFYFYYLKQRQFRAALQHFKKHRKDRVMFLCGIRRSESTDRLTAPEIRKDGSGIWVNPIVYWSELDIADYRVFNDLPRNPFYDLTGNSGDCMCNWHNRIPLDKLKKHATAASKIILPLDAQCREKFGYGYDNEPTKRPEDNGQMTLPLFDWNTRGTPNLCAGCSKPEHASELVDFAQLQRMEW
jgi:3'-phosphoadenosine 5'-phosphosulfate sulfotransferase (PAPS reductase)/FAD synthetase